jgi:hypothetical protein
MFPPSALGHAGYNQEVSGLDFATGEGEDLLVDADKRSISS